MDPIQVFVETGKKKVFVGAVDWPGWCRSGRDETLALQVLIDYGPRYAQVLHSREIEFRAPSDASGLIVTERHDGNATTDFGAPAVVLDADREPIDRTEFERSRALLLACWQAFDGAVQQATGKELRKGPRGGGRDIEKIIDHVLQADTGYLTRLAWKHKGESETSLDQELGRARQAVLDALGVAIKGNLPQRGPRGNTVRITDES